MAFSSVLMKSHRVRRWKAAVSAPDASADHEENCLACHAVQGYSAEICGVNQRLCADAALLQHRRRPAGRNCSCTYTDLVSWHAWYPVSQFTRSKHEDTLENQNRKLRTTQQELDQYFASSLDLLCIADTSGHFIRLNPEWEKVLGYPLSELEGQLFLDFVHRMI